MPTSVKNLARPQTVAGGINKPNGISLSADQQFLVVSEYGASIWCDTRLWIAEAARLLRPGGELVFMRGSTLRNLCVPEDEGPATDRLLAPQKGLYRIDWQEGSSALPFRALQQNVRHSPDRYECHS